jgi:NACalpha-BTF3-like transcription factor
MTDFKEKYINPFTDYGFKRLFGGEPNKDILLDFLNELLKDEQGTITELTYLKNENLGSTELNRNLHKLDRIPEKLKETIFLKLFETAEIAKFSQQEYQDYENSLKYYRDLKNSLDTAKEERSIEIAKKMLNKEMDISLISEMTGLTENEIIELKNRNKSMFN